MKTKQLVVRSAVTVVATGLTLLSSGNSQASGRGPSGMRMGGSRGGMHNGAIHQGISQPRDNARSGCQRCDRPEQRKIVSLNRGP